MDETNQYQAIKSLIEGSIGKREHFSHAQLGAGIVTFCYRLQQEKIYAALPAEQRGFLVDHLDALIRTLAQESVSIARQSTSKRVAQTFALHTRAALQPFFDQCNSPEIERPLVFENLSELLESVVMRDATRVGNRQLKKMSEVLRPLYAATDGLGENQAGTVFQHSYLPENGPHDIRLLIYYLKLCVRVLQSKQFERRWGPDTSTPIITTTLR